MGHSHGLDERDEAVFDEFPGYRLRIEQPLQEQAPHERAAKFAHLRLGHAELDARPLGEVDNGVGDDAVGSDALLDQRDAKRLVAGRHRARLRHDAGPASVWIVAHDDAHVLADQRVDTRDRGANARVVSKSLLHSCAVDGEEDSALLAKLA